MTVRRLLADEKDYFKLTFGSNEFQMFGSKKFAIFRSVLLQTRHSNLKTMIAFASKRFREKRMGERPLTLARSKGGRQGRTPLWSKFFHFHSVFGKILTK